MTDPQLNSLFAQARARCADTSKFEYSFETRALARIRAEREAREETSSIWAKVSWRMAPIFTAFVIGLAIWQSELSSLTDDALAFNSMEHPEATDFWSN